MSGSSNMGGFGAGRMGPTPHGYHLAELSCSVPLSMPGTTVCVMLGDMGTSQMMGGVAPLGGPMNSWCSPSRRDSKLDSECPVQTAGSMRLAAWARLRPRALPDRVRGSSPGRSVG